MQGIPWAQLGCVVFCILFAGAAHHFIRKSLENFLQTRQVRRNVREQQKLWHP